ncbi:MAG TPA: hydrogenase subunit MbhD domain-containing protein [Candidatus Baltobacteraceae bacterium]|nr:hydrogenase subunit MbhD domain-containing protein [Candidatus Baltobacteraceae bacterium]
MSLLQVVLYVFIAFLGAAAVFSKRPVNQLFIYSLFGMMLALLFFVLHAPDVALSEIAVGTLAVPIMVLVALMKTGDKT